MVSGAAVCEALMNPPSTVTSVGTSELSESGSWIPLYFPVLYRVQSCVDQIDETYKSLHQGTGCNLREGSPRPESRSRHGQHSQHVAQKSQIVEAGVPTKLSSTACPVEGGRSVAEQQERGGH
jgi:hypothetical protein